MKINVYIIVVIIAGILYGCAGKPDTVESFDSDRPVFRDSPYLMSDTANRGNYSEMFQSSYTKDSITIFTFNDISITIDSVNSTRTRGRDIRPSGNYDAIIRQLENEHKINPDNYEVNIRLASSYINRALNESNSDAELAITILNEDLMINNNDPEALLMRGLAYRAWGKFEDSNNYFMAFIRSGPHNTKGAYYLIGMNYWELGNNEEAIRAFRRVGALDPNFSDIKEILEILIDM